LTDLSLLSFSQAQPYSAAPEAVGAASPYSAAVIELAVLLSAFQYSLVFIEKLTLLLQPPLMPQGNAPPAQAAVPYSQPVSDFTLLSAIEAQLTVRFRVQDAAALASPAASAALSYAAVQAEQHPLAGPAPGPVVPAVDSASPAPAARPWNEGDSDVSFRCRSTKYSEFQCLLEAKDKLAETDVEGAARVANELQELVRRLHITAIAVARPSHVVASLGPRVHIGGQDHRTHNHI
jgi:hypothetical protein